MIPIGDDNTDRRSAPFVTWMFIALNVFVFVFGQKLGSNEHATLAYATVPYEILTGKDVAQPVPIRDEYGRTVSEIDLQPTPIPVYLTLLTSMFMHGSLSHLLGNMLYLWIFGDNVEDVLGHLRYLFFYLATGIVAGLSHVFSARIFGGNLLVPSLGASGAIAGVLGGYIVLFPRRRVRVIFLYQILQVPALLAIGVWFLFQLVSGAGTLHAQGGGVAYAAHIGGFVIGAILVRMFLPRSTAAVPARGTY
jgi:membrane associated rhomboid family serine protease